jgi:hypothetical protein
MCAVMDSISEHRQTLQPLETHLHETPIPISLSLYLIIFVMFFAGVGAGQASSGFPAQEGIQEGVTLRFDHLTIEDGLSQNGQNGSRTLHGEFNLLFDLVGQQIGKIYSNYLMDTHFE